MLSAYLFKIGNQEFLLENLFFVVGILIGTWLFLFIFKKSIYKSNRIDIGRKFAIYQIVKYFSFVISAVLVMQTLGIDVTVLIASSAALLVGLGMGIQHLFSDLVSGFIVLFDGTIKVGDIIELDGMISKVKEINLRTTTVETRGDKYIIIPNSSLTNHNLINWTHSNKTSRFEIKVGVDYSSDIDLVMQILLEEAIQHKDVLQEPMPMVRLVDFGNSSIDFELLFWSDQVFRVEQVKSEIRINIFKHFAKSGIVIPFPQRTVHIHQKDISK